MMNLTGYDVREKIYSGKKSMVYRGVRQTDQQPVIIKVSNTEYPTLRQLARYRREFEIASSLNSDSAVRPLAMERYGNGLALILEDSAAVSLGEYVEDRNPGLDELIDIFIGMAGALNWIHSTGVVHKDIKPRNIIIQPENGEVRFIDFGISSRLSREKSFLRSPSKLEGTLSYIAPEQTGRMNRGVDHRADMYSLGVTFFELLTGRLPFQATDPAELVHMHLAVEPPDPHEISADIPYVISKIVLKLLAKTPEERYQSCRGLKADLETCLASLRESNQINDFELGRKDHSDQFHITEKLYGRENEIAELMDSFGETRQGDSVLLLVSGHAGIGKSVLVNEIHQSIAEQRGYFISGKFDQYMRNVPYSALIQSFVGLIQQILAEDQERIKQWREKLLAALGLNGQVIIDVIPQVELIIGPQPEVAKLPPAESRNRFQIYFQNFIRVFAEAEHPLVVFLDDLQWADSASLQLLEALISDPDGKHLLMIGAFRDNEVDEAHPLTGTLKRIDEAGVITRNIFLNPLQLRDIKKMLSETFLRDVSAVEGLANLIIEKTYGNPFFVIEFLSNLYREKLVNYDENRDVWSWDLEKIKKLGITDNVVEFMSGRIRGLSARAQELITLAACLGNRFGLDELALIYGKSPSETAAELDELLRNGLILPGDESYKYVGQEDVVGNSGEGEQDRVQYDFLHDRVQQAAYSLIAEDRRSELHLTIGRQLLARLPERDREDKIIDIVGHLNLGMDRIEDPEEKLNLARLNFQAGLKARSSAAMKGALFFYRQAILCMPADIWTVDYDLAFGAFLERAAMEHANLEFEESETYLSLAVERAASDRDRARVHELRVTLFNDQGRFVEAIEAGREGLRLLGLEVPAEVPPPVLKGEIEELVDLPEMTDEAQIAGMRILSSLLMPAIFASSPYFPAFVFTMVQRSLDYGSSPYSAIGYVNYAIILCGHIRDYDSGYRFGRLSLNVQEKTMETELKGRTFAFYAVFVHSWKHHVDDTMEYLLTAYENAMLEADLYFAATAVFFVCIGRYGGGATENILTSLNRFDEYRAAIRKTGVQPIIEQYSFNEQFLHNLRGKAKDKFLLIGDAFDERAMMPIFLETQNVVSEWAMYQLKSILAYVFGAYRETLDLSTKAVEKSGPVAGTIQIPLMLLINCLAHSIVCDEEGEAEKREEHLETIQNNLTLLEQMAEHSPQNYRHFSMLASAELARLKRDNERAEELYDQAIEVAGENRYVFIEAVASERAARHYQSIGKTRFAGVYLTDAHYAYTRWGATEKVKDLEEQHPELLVRRAQPTSSVGLTTSTSSTYSSTMETHGRVLDLNSLMKAAQVISGELVLDRLIDQLVRIVLENAGAERVLLFLNRDNELFVEAMGSTRNAEIELVRESAESRNDFARAVVHYVERSGEYVLLNDAIAEGMFRRDPYVLERQPKSLLCLPIMYQNRLSGLLYMENNLTVGAFTADRLESLNLLSGQIAISIEHAMLYGNLEEKVMERTRKLREAQSKLLVLEKEATERQMAGGFAHEMRNALSGTRIVLEQILSVGEDDPGLNIRHSDRFKELLQNLEGRLGPEDVATVKAALEEVLEDENMVESIMKVVYKATMRGLRITKEILDYSKIGQDEAPMQAVLLADVIKQAAEEVQKDRLHPGIRLNLSLAEKLEFEGRENDFYSVVRNLIQNAFDAVKDSASAAIDVSLKEEGENGVLRVVDTGPGIPAENLEKIFDAFYSTKPETGTGLGLGIVKKIISSYSGDISVKSEVGKGTEFLVRLPIQSVL